MTTLRAYMSNAKQVYTHRAALKNWLALAISPTRIKCAQLRDAQLLYRVGTTDLMMMMEIWASHLYAQNFPRQATGTVLDIGAHNGYFAVYASRHGDATARVIAYEPVPANAELARQNIARNRLANVTLVQAAVAGASGTLTLHLNAKNTGGHSMFRDRVQKESATPAATVAVPSEALTDVFARHVITRCRFMKIDCEGAEFDILLNAPAAILQKVEAICMEFHEFGGHRVDEIVDCLKPLGFDVDYAYSPSQIGIRFGLLTALRKID